MRLIPYFVWLIIVFIYTVLGGEMKTFLIFNLHCRYSAIHFILPIYTWQKSQQGHEDDWNYTNGQDRRILPGRETEFSRWKVVRHIM